MLRRAPGGRVLTTYSGRGRCMQIAKEEVAGVQRGWDEHPGRVGRQNRRPG